MLNKFHGYMEKLSLAQLLLILMLGAGMIVLGFLLIPSNIVVPFWSWM